MEIWLADLIVVVHFLFVVFVVTGGLLLFWSKKAVIVHIPAVFWGAFIEFSGGICPLTPLENYFRYKAGREVYESGFIENYILPILYPSGLTREIQIILGTAVIVINLFVYLFAFRNNLRSLLCDR